MLSFRVVELERVRERVQHTVGCSREVASLQTHVVIHGNPGKHRHLFAPQSRNATVSPVGRKTSLVRRDASTPGTQELPHLSTDISHASTLRPVHPEWEALRVPGCEHAQVRC